MKEKDPRKFVAYLLLFIFIIIPIAPLHENKSNRPMNGHNISPASVVSTGSIPVSSSGFVYWHRNDGYVVQSTGNNQTKVGHDFDYWNEAWRGWYSFDISSLNQSAQIISVQLKFRVVGKPEESNSARSQLGFYYQETSPLIYDTKENLYNRLNSGTQLRNGGFFSVAEVTQFPNETDYIDLGKLGAKSLERSISNGIWSISVVDQFEGQENSEFDEGLILELAEIVVSFVPNGNIIKVNTPNGNQSYPFNSILDITWNSSYSVDSVSIVLYKNGILLLKIAENISNLNKHNWTIPSTLDPLSKYMIGVYDSSNESLMGISVEFEVVKQNYSPTTQDFIVILIAIGAVIVLFIGIYIYGKRKTLIEHNTKEINNETIKSSKSKAGKKTSSPPIICSYCGTENDPESLECRYCGKEFE